MAQVSTASGGLALSPALRRRLAEAAAIALACLALVLAFALGSYAAADPGFSFTGTGEEVRNLIGRGGAWLADVLYFAFGLPAWILVATVPWSAWRLWRQPSAVPAEQGRGPRLLRVVAGLLLMASSCGLAALHWDPGELRQSAGGALGIVVGGTLADALQLLGATLVLLSVFLVAFSLALQVSWLRVMDVVGHFVLHTPGQVLEWWEGRRSFRRGVNEKRARAGTRAASARKSASRQEPDIEVPVLAPVVIEAPPPPAPRSQRAEKERQVKLFEPMGEEGLPPLSLLDDPPPPVLQHSEEALAALSRLVEEKLRDFGIEVQVVAVHPGPVVTRFELQPAPGVKVSQISSLSKDLARSLSAVSVRVVEVIPGKPVMGLEIPNDKRELVSLGEIIKSRAYDDLGSPLALALGKDISGTPMVADLARMPHLLIAGTTGSGKSVGINAMILSLLYKARPDQVRLIMIDPKMLELSVYEGIPHLLAPVVTDMKQAANALRWCVAEMERRYQLMAALGVRNLAGFNRKVNDANEAGKPIKDPVMMAQAANDPRFDQSTIPDLQTLPFIVVVIDELADLMMIVGKKVEELIARLAQKARASGIHLILATQRPSVDVITGLIKANIPTRMAFQVSAKVDSRTILDQGGAESLLGHGDMLYLPPGTSVPTRIHGAFVSDDEVHRVVECLRQATPPDYVEEVLSGPSMPIPGLSGEDEGGGSLGGDAEQDALYDEAVKIVLTERKPSISYVQRRLKIGYNRAARLIEAMEQAGLVGPLNTNGSREVIAPPPGD
ncbi:MAG: hypothetical protein RL026_388 [Pseudomonadota bacterium]